MQPLVSVLIPNYNKASYLRYTLDSVLNQTYANWECIIVDDHSTDGSWDILEDYSIRDTRFKISKRPADRKSGGNAARNYALEMARGEFVAYLDSDDIWLPNRITASIEFMISNGYRAIYSGAVVEYPNKTVKHFSRDLSPSESCFDFVINREDFSPTPTFVLNRKVALGVRFDENMLRHQDYDFFIRVNEVCKWRYFENFDVKIIWNAPRFKNFNFNYCIPFYLKHSSKSNDILVKINYIRSIVSLSCRNNPSKEFCIFFKKELIKISYNFSVKEIVMFNYPLLFHYMFRFKSLLIYGK
jgi:glycosyltransferase involved in cell wall biosynthesis